MKIFFFILTFTYGNVAKAQDTCQFSVSVIDLNSRKVYYADNERIGVGLISHSQYTMDSVLMQRPVKPGELKLFAKYFSGHNIDTLQEFYSSAYIMDGEVKVIHIGYAGKKKAIQLRGVYVRALADLYDIINDLVEERYRFWYTGMER